MRNGHDPSAAPPKPNATRATAKTLAAVAGTFPLGIGRCFLRGCKRSPSTSAKSFIVYTAAASRQKTEKAPIARMSSIGSNTSLANTTGARTKTFLIHWWGRAVHSSPMATPPTPLSADVVGMTDDGSEDGSSFMASGGLRAARLLTRFCQYTNESADAVDQRREEGLV